MIHDDTIIFGMLMIILGFVFATSQSEHWVWRKFYAVVPMLLMCYFLPSLLTITGLVDAEASQLYYVATRYLLPASLVLLTISIDLREVLRLGPKAIIMFLVGTIGVVLGGPVAILVVGTLAPDWIGGSDSEAIWKGLSTVAGSWIGGGANQVAMKEIFLPSDQLFSVMVAVDVVIAEVWMAFLLLGVGKAERIDAWLKADTSSVERLTRKMEAFSKKTMRVPSTADLFTMLGWAFGVTAVSHFAANQIAGWIDMHAPGLDRFSLNSSFFWLILLATTGGVALSFTRVRNLEGAGASKIGSVFIYILVATIGLKMDVTAVWSNPGPFVIGAVWMMFHVAVLVIVAWRIRAPYFFLAVGSKANIGGAASAPVVAAAFHPSLAPVGVLLAVVGYALGTYAAYVCTLLMQAAAAT